MPARIIFTHARSGSTSLGRAIRDASGTSIGFEPFGRAMRTERGIEPDSAEFPAYAAEIAERYDVVKHLWRVFTPEQNRIFLSHSGYGAIVFLYRENVAAACLSQMVAFHTREWDKNPGTKRLRWIKVDVLRGLVEALTEQIRTYREMAEATGRVRMSVRYEELYSSKLAVEDKKRLLSRICQALEVETQDAALLEATTKYLMPDARYNGPDRYATIPNVDELVAVFGPQVLGDV